MTINKRVCVLVPILVLVVGVWSAAAQAISVKGGFTFSQLQLSDADMADLQEPQLNPTGGIAIDFSDGKAFGLQLEALFAQRGLSLSEGLFADDGAKVRATYIDVPVLFRWNAGPGYFFGGATMGVRVALTQEITIGGETIEEELLADDEVSTFDVGITGGLGFNMGPVFIEGRYTHGLTNFATDLEEGEDASHQVYSVMLGIRFR